MNQAFVRDAAAAESQLPLVERWYAGRSDGFRIILRDPADARVQSAATAGGYVVSRSQPLMCARLPLAQFPIPAGYQSTMVQSAHDIHDYLSVREPNSSRPPDETEGEFIAAVIATGRFSYFVARDAGRPIATASSAFADGVVHVSNVWVKEDARLQGLGASMTALAAAAFPGAEWAALEASAMGEPVYRQMGFEERYRYVRMTPPVRLG